MMSKKCPMCRGEIRIFEDNEPGDEVYCEDCEQEFEIISIAPIRLEALESSGYYEEDSFGTYDEFYDD